MNKGSALQDQNSVSEYLRGQGYGLENEIIGRANPKKEFSSFKSEKENLLSHHSTELKPDSYENELEQKEEGEVKFKTLKVFVNAMGVQMFLFILLGGVLMQLSRGAYDMWLKDYVQNLQQEKQPSFFLFSFNFTLFCLSLFALICCSYRAWIFAYGNLQSSKRIFEKLLPTVLYSRMSFFDQNPVGRILQRFTADTTSLDDGFPFQWNILLNNVVMFLRTLAIFSIEIPIILLGKTHPINNLFTFSFSSNPHRDLHSTEKI